MTLNEALVVRHTKNVYRKLIYRVKNTEDVSKKCNPQSICTVVATQKSLMHFSIINSHARM
jgi:hypothetical protein